MDQLEWVNAFRRRYDIDVDIITHENPFSTHEYHCTDPRGIALGFSVFTDEQNRISAFTTDVFDFGWFHAAEGISEAELLDAAQHCLDGNLHFRKGLFGKISLDFDGERGKLRPGHRLDATAIEGFLKGYATKSGQ